MLNNFVIVGRVVDIIEDSNEIKINVTRSYKNENGEYENDLLSIFVTDNIFKSVNEYVEKGNLIGTKGRIENYENKTILMADKITFLSSKK